MIELFAVHSFLHLTTQFCNWFCITAKQSSIAQLPSLHFAFRNNSHMEVSKRLDGETCSFAVKVSSSSSLVSQ